MTPKNIFIKLLWLNIVASFIIFFTTSTTILINFQIGFFSSLGIVFGSYLGFKSKIENRTKNSIVNYNDIDEIDKIEDPYDLYSSINHEEISEEEFKDIVAQEKKRYSNSSIKNLKHSTPMFSIYRILGYIFLILGFFYLNNNHILDITTYIISIGLAPIAILIINFLQ